MEQDFSIGSQQELAAIALENSLAQATFELLDLQADCRLRASHTLGCPCKPGVVYDRNEGSKQIKVEGG